MGLLFATAQVNPDTDGELISGIEHGAKGLVEPTNYVQEILARNLMPVLAIEFCVIMHHNPGRKWLLHSQDMSAPCDVELALDCVKQHYLLPENNGTHLVRVYPVPRFVKVAFGSATETEHIAVQLDLVTFPGVMVDHDPFTIFAAKEVWVVLEGVLGTGMNYTFRVVAENVIPKR